jgi:3-methylfumaryl-CoA hydratase
VNTPDLKAWIGRREARRDSAAPNQAMAMAATLDLDPDAFRTGATLPEFWHWIYFTHPIRRSRLGEDGHELRGDFMPPVDLPRRMWAGGRVRFLRPIVIGASIERASEIISIDEKQGRSGPLVLTTVRHIISDAAGPCVEEEQDIVYCEIPKSNESTRQQEILPVDVQWRETFLPDAVTLFRYSALMFNAHRIHFDHPFTTEVEGYRGLLVHGPLTATLLLEAAKRNVQRELSSFRYRGLAPLFNNELITLAGRNTKHEDETELWAADLNGVIAMQGATSWRN